MQWLKHQYERAIEGMTEDIAHLREQIERVEDPQEKEQLKKLRMNMVDRMIDFKGALESFE